MEEAIDNLKAAVIQIMEDAQTRDHMPKAWMVGVEDFGSAIISYLDECKETLYVD